MLPLRLRLLRTQMKWRLLLLRLRHAVAAAAASEATDATNAGDGTDDAVAAATDVPAGDAAGRDDSAFGCWNCGF